MKASLFKKIMITSLICAVTVSDLAGCGGSSDNTGSGSAAFKYAEARVKTYNSEKAFRSAAFYDRIFSTANAAAMIVNDKTSEEDFQNVARYLYLDSITVTDEKGNITASYPDGEKGKALKDSEDKKIFNRVARGISVKLMSDPVKADDADGYSLLAGVARENGEGAVIVSLKTEEYSIVTGEKLAEECGANTMIISDGSVISSTFDKVEAGTSAEAIGIKPGNIKAGTFSISVDGESYNCTGETLKDLTLVCVSSD